MAKAPKRFGWVVPLVVLLFVVEASVYTFFHLHVVKVGYRIHKLSSNIVDLSDENRILKFKLAALKTPDNIEKEMAKKNLKLEECTDRKIVWLDEPTANIPTVNPVPANFRPEGELFFYLYPDAIGARAAASKK